MRKSSTSIKTSMFTYKGTSINYVRGSGERGQAEPEYSVNKFQQIFFLYMFLD